MSSSSQFTKQYKLNQGKTVTANYILFNQINYGVKRDQIN